MASFRNTMSAVFNDFLAHLVKMEGESAGSLQKLRTVAAGEGGIGEHPVPFLTIRVSKTEVVGSLDGDKQWAVDLKFRLVSQIESVEDAQVEILNRIAQVEDQIDSYKRPDGVTGLEAGTWSSTPSQGSEGGNFTIAESIKTYTVVVERGDN